MAFTVVLNLIQKLNVTVRFAALLAVGLGHFAKGNAADTSMAAMNLKPPNLVPISLSADPCVKRDWLGELINFHSNPQTCLSKIKR